MSVTRRSPCIALLTDFGLHDPYVGIMKGVLLTRLPRIPLIDISHDIPPGDIRNAAYQLWTAFRYFPSRTVFACVVDPGVGTEREIEILQTKQHTFVAPANGMLAFIAHANPRAESYSASKQAISRFGVKPVSSTFHGRDIIAPIAAELARGVDVRSFGVKRKPSPVPSPFMYPSDRPKEIQVLHVDRFGNVITSLFAGSEPRLMNLRIRKGKMVAEKFVSTFADGGENEPSMLIGSMGLVELVMKNGRAAEIFDIRTGDVLEAAWHE